MLTHYRARSSIGQSGPLECSGNVGSNPAERTISYPRDGGFGDDKVGITLAARSGSITELNAIMKLGNTNIATGFVPI